MVTEPSLVTGSAGFSFGGSGFASGGGAGFSWAVAGDKANSVFAWLRHAPGAGPILVVANMTPVPRHGYRVPVPHDGRWQEIVNSDAQQYGGSGVGNFGAVDAAQGGLVLTLPPLATVMLEYRP